MGDSADLSLVLETRVRIVIRDAAHMTAFVGRNDLAAGSKKCQQNDQELHAAAPREEENSGEAFVPWFFFLARAFFCFWRWAARISSI